jgi:NAD(P)-dependent dehydrogenase (short-subunit alcohol dehydrogenase family)
MSSPQHIVITGANRGIGLALTQQLVAEGHHMWATHRPQADTGALQRLQETARSRLKLVPLDVRNLADCQAFSQSLGAQPIDVLWNNAGLLLDREADITALDFDHYAAMLEVNTLGPLRVIQSLLPQLRRSQHAKILNLSSVMGSIGKGGAGASGYRTSKAALNRALRTVAEDVRQWNIAVLCLHPGWVKTDMGGLAADIDISESAQGLIRMMHNSTLADTGQFWDYQGKVLPW